jgi:hypothetical protein
LIASRHTSSSALADPMSIPPAQHKTEQSTKAKIVSITVPLLLPSVKGADCDDHRPDIKNDKATEYADKEAIVIAI